jgi:LacI family transcriptional regulator, kdg operon repressor
MKKVTIGDVAKRANVSKSTVSQYLNKNYHYMGEATKLEIAKAIKELGYQPNIIARSLKQKATSTIGLIAANILHAFSTQVIRAVEDVCQEHDFNLIICNADDDPDKEKKHIEMLLAKQVDGLIIFPTGENLDLYQKMVDANYPIVFVDRMIEDVAIPTVLLDNEKASELAVHHFLDRGYERIGIITTSIIKHVTPRIERINGYKKTLEKNNIPINPDYIKSLELANMEEGIGEMLSANKPPQAILAGNDLSLIEILKYIKKHQLQIPKDVAIIGIDDVSFATFYYPAITTIAQPTFEIGNKAANLLLSKIKKQDNENLLVYRYEPKLIIRQST